ncbi:hypothetical protein JTE90_026803 [Oedothorax gibbosus]|uniref:Uncharacterized protein n=1 Tax=Oedothorax gibbosus TaxID=931172 RepID=A0AAV6UQ87_9ARAC|nr:hypothetical protein JTE90_026803 [Oedothorax gibbosus]
MFQIIFKSENIFFFHGFFSVAKRKSVTARNVFVFLSGKSWRKKVMCFFFIFLQSCLVRRGHKKSWVVPIPSWGLISCPTL